MTTTLPIIVITGPTASGKTSLAIQTAIELNAEIICADSRIVYKDFDVVSAKPSVDERMGIIHHLIDIKTPHEPIYSAGDFVEDAKKATEVIKSKNKNIIITGGTWFYIKSLLDEHELLPLGADYKLREELEKTDSKTLWKKLNEVDTKRASEIHFNNKDKIIRALEMVNSLDNKPVSSCRRTRNKKYDAIWFMRDYTDKREELYERINKRVDIMLNLGLLKEFENNKKKYGRNKVLQNTIGYKEFFELEDGLYKSFDETIEKVKQHTRNFAKRQLTYFRSNKDIIPVNTVADIKNSL